MKQYFLFSFFLLTQLVKADVGDPWVQAVCKITLDNGKTIEGLISLGDGGYFGIWMNGFRIEEFNNQKHQNQINFNFDLRKIEFTDSTIVYSTFKNEKSNPITLNTKGNVRHFEWSQDYNNSKDDSLIKINGYTKYFQIKDSFIIYFDMTSNSFLDTVEVFQNTRKKIDHISIAANQIKIFELIEHPDKFWLDKIKLANITFDKNNEEGTGDWQHAAWFHEITADKELYEYYQSHIKHYQFPN